MSVAIPFPPELPKSAGILVNNNVVVDGLRAGLSSGQHGFDLVPLSIQDIIENGAWMDRIDRNGLRHTYGEGRFSEFLTDPAPSGVGTTVDEVRKYLGSETDPVRVKFEQLVDRGRGGANRIAPTQDPITGMFAPTINPNVIRVDGENDGDPVTIPIRERDRSREPQAGTSFGYLVRRLGRERPDLLARVESGEVTAHKAATEAGFVEHKVSVPRDDPERAAKILLRHLNPEQVKDLIVALSRAAFRTETD